MSDDETRGEAWRYVTEHYDELYARMSENSRAGLPYAAEGFCDQASRDAAAQFFAERKDDLLGGERVLRHVLEQVDQCIALRAAHAESLERALKSGR